LDNKKSRMFDLIAPVYSLYYTSQQRRYRAALGLIRDTLDGAGCKSVLDIGCGTGALCSVLHESGYAVTGVDSSAKMLAHAKKKSPAGIAYLQADAVSPLPFADKSFDLCVASYVAHGLKAGERKALYAETDRLAYRFVILYDYSGGRSLLTNLIEWLEGGDYFNFIRSAESELGQAFERLTVVPADIRAAWYVCVPKKEPRV